MSKSSLEPPKSRYSTVKPGGGQFKLATCCVPREEGALEGSIQALRIRN
uniref:Uncharacterized protein n=1 Tax=Arundo donax TaxID=35708 RepID=A0A0A8Z984_ARUDO